MDIEKILGVSFESGKHGIKGEHRSKINGNIKRTCFYSKFGFVV